MNLNLLMSISDYKSGNYQTPYFFVIRGKKQTIFYFGAKHSYNPNHKQFRLLENFWDDFLVQTKKINCIVLIEGGIRPIPKNETDGIREGGEASFVTFLANKEHIEIYSPEPNQSTERQELLKKFTKEQIQYYYFARTINQWYRRNCSPSFDNYIQNFLKNSKRLRGWEDFDFSLENMKKIHKRLFDTKFNEKDKNLFAKSVDPTKKLNILNKIAAESGIIRDTHILSEIKKLWDKKKNIFIVYGQAHAVMQEPVLRDLAN